MCGNILWDIFYEGSKIQFYEVEPATDSGFILVGNTNFGIFAIKTTNA